MAYTVGVITASDKSSRGEREDLSGPAIRAMVQEAGGTVLRYLVLPDEAELLTETLRAWADAGDLDVLFTTGGTGLSPRDVTPEATLAVLHRETPGIAEALRVESTHYQRMLNYVMPDIVHVLFDGRIVRSGGQELALELEDKGYEWIREEVAAGANS